MSNPLIYSLFLSKYFGAWEEYVSDIDYAKVIVEKQGAKDVRYNALYTQGFEKIVSTPTTQAIAMTAYTQADRLVLMGEIIGEGAIKVDGLDFDGSTPITCLLHGKGVPKFPARVLYGGQNVTGITLIPYEDNVVFRLKTVVVCAATDTRYT